MSSHLMWLGSDLQFSQPDPKPLDGVVAVAAFEPEGGFLGGLGCAFQLGKFLSPVAVFAPFLAAVSPCHRPGLSSLVQRYGVGGVVFALWAVGVHFLRKLHVLRPMGRVAGVGPCFYPFS